MMTTEQTEEQVKASKKPAAKKAAKKEQKQAEAKGEQPILRDEVPVRPMDPSRPRGKEVMPGVWVSDQDPEAPKARLQAGDHVRLEDGRVARVEEVSDFGATIRMPDSTTQRIAATSVLPRVDPPTKRPEAGTVPAVKGKPGRKKFIPTPEETAKVLELRAQKMTYQQIEAAMGWPDGHGNRPWRIVQDAEAAAKAAK